MLNQQLYTVFKSIYRWMGSGLRKRFWRVMGLSVVVALTEFGLAAAVALLGVVLASPQTIVQSGVMRRLVELFPFLQPMTEDPRLLLICLLAVLCGAVLCKSLSLALLTWRQSSFSQALNLEMARRLFHGFVNAPYLWHVGQRVSDLVTMLGWTSYVGQYCFAVVQALGQLAVAVVLIVVVFVATPVVGGIVFTGTTVAAYLSFRFSRRLVNISSQEVAQGQRDAGRIAHTALYGVRELMIYPQQRAFESRYVQCEGRAARGRALLPVWNPLPSWTLEWVGMVLLLGAVLLLYWRDTGIAATVGALTLLAAVAWRLLPIINRLVQQLLIMQQQIPQIGPVLRKLEEVDALLPSAPEKAADCPLTKDLQLKNVSFRYPGTPDGWPDALRGLDLRIPRGSMVGFVGLSGAGKSTVVALLTGLFPPTSGKILVDGRPMDNALRAGWIRRIGYVPQSPFLLNASIAENIAFSHWGTTVDRARVQQCCRMAAMDFVDDLEQGLDTVIGERGVRLSGGQIQRVAIARALYHDPQFILFDEATSALDGAAEQAIQQTIDSLRSRMTLVVVAHRLSTVQACDTVYWIDEGEVRMAGTPESVLPAYEAYLAAKNGACGEGTVPPEAQGA